MNPRISATILFLLRFDPLRVGVRSPSHVATNFHILSIRIKNGRCVIRLRDSEVQAACFEAWREIHFKRTWSMSDGALVTLLSATGSH